VKNEKLYDASLKRHESAKGRRHEGKEKFFSL
jgi:hypothetical protein